MSLQTTESAPTTAPPISIAEAGTLIGGRYCVQRLNSPHPFGPVFDCQDNHTSQEVAVQLVHVPDRAAFGNLRSYVQRATLLRHRCLGSTFGFGNHQGDIYYVAHERIVGHSVAQLLAEPRTDGPAFTLRAALNVVVHLCKALDTVHPHSTHGALRPAVVWLTQSGRVKLQELATSRMFLERGLWRQLPVTDQLYLAPEIRAGQPPTVASDIYGLGALLHGMLTGEAPDGTLAPCSGRHPEADAVLDALLDSCLEPDPQQRFESVSTLAAALLPQVSRTPPAPNVMPAAQPHVELDVDVAAALPVPPPQARAPIVEDARSGSSVPAPAKPSMPPITHLPPPPPKAPPPPPTHEEELAALLEELTRNDAPIWMAVKDGMDHGPFTNRELVKCIVDGEILATHDLFDIHGRNERRPVATYAQFNRFVEQYQVRKDEADAALAMARSAKDEQRSKLAKFTLLGSALVALVILGGGYLTSRKDAPEAQTQDDLDLASVYSDGQVKIVGTADLLKPPATGLSTRGARRSGTPRTPGGFDSYEAAMSRAIELGNVQQGGGERQLSGNQVAATMNRHLGGMFQCVTQERRGGHTLGKVRIDLAIAGTGAVMGASIRTGSDTFQRCVAERLRRVTFPTFPAPRMGASYSFDAS